MNSFLPGSLNRVAQPPRPWVLAARLHYVAQASPPAGSPGVSPGFLSMHGLAALISLAVLMAGCGRNPVEQALQTDANGYVCQVCKAKFYTDRDTYANICPTCKSSRIAQVVGFLCPTDHHVSVGPRGVGSLACEKCGQSTSGVAIPRSSDLQAWGAAKKTRAEVGG